MVRVQLKVLLRSDEPQYCKALNADFVYRKCRTCKETSRVCMYCDRNMKDIISSGKWLVVIGRWAECFLGIFVVRIALYM